MAVLVLFSSVPLFMMVNKNFMPQDDQAEFEVNIRAPEGTSLESTEVITNRIANAMRQHLPEIDYTLVTVGGDPGQDAQSRQHLHPADADRVADARSVRRHERRSQGGPAPAVRRPAHVGAAGGGDRRQAVRSAADVQFVINGPDLPEARVDQPADGRARQDDSRRRRS